MLWSNPSPMLTNAHICNSLQLLKYMQALMQQLACLPVSYQLDAQSVRRESFFSCIHRYKFNVDDVCKIIVNTLQGRLGCSLVTLRLGIMKFSFELCIHMLCETFFLGEKPDAKPHDTKSQDAYDETEARNVTPASEVSVQGQTSSPSTKQLSNGKLPNNNFQDNKTARQATSLLPDRQVQRRHKIIGMLHDAACADMLMARGNVGTTSTSQLRLSSEPGTYDCCQLQASPIVAKSQMAAWKWSPSVFSYHHAY